MPKHAIRRIISKVHSTEWAITAEKFAEIDEFLTARRDGALFDAEEIRDRLGPMNQRRGEGSGITEAHGQIALLNLFGVVSQRMNMMTEISGGTSTEQFASAFDAAVADENVSSIVIHVDSPGGAVPGVAELSDRIFSARGTKPIIAVADPLMASAAYWIASAADQIVATASSDVGSIGCMAMHKEYSKAAEKAGITSTLFASAPFKGEGNSDFALSDAAKSNYQDRVDAIHDKFVASVARNRDLSVESVNQLFGQGRTLMAEDALKVGMIDRIASLESVLAELGASTPQPAAVTPVRSQRPAFFKGLAQMDKAIFEALVKRGFISVDATEAQAEAAVSNFFNARGEVKPAEVAEIVAALTVNTAAKPAPVLDRITENKTAESGCSLQTVRSLIAMSPLKDLEAAAQMDLLAELQGKSADVVASRINQEAAKIAGPSGHSVTRVVADSKDKLMDSARDAILQQTYGGDLPEQVFNYSTREMVAYKPKRPSYALATGTGLAQACFRACGVSQSQIDSLSPAQQMAVAMGADVHEMGLGYMASDGGGYNVSGMFSNILLDASNVVLRRSYDEQRTTFKDWMKQAPSLPDFKFVHKVIAGELGDPRAIPENGQFEETTLTDSKEKYRLTVWGERFSYSWQLAVNDQLRSFMEIPMKLGSAYRRKENRLAYAELKNNAALQADSVALFHASAVPTGHNNITTGALTTVADYVGALNTLAKKMAAAKGLDTTNGGVLGLRASYLVYPSALMGIIRQLLISPSADATNPGLLNIWQGGNGLMPIEEPELGAASTNGSDVVWYTATKSSENDTIEYARLQGYEAPVLEKQTSFERLAFAYRIYSAFAVKAIDYRGLQRHNGA